MTKNPDTAQPAAPTSPAATAQPAAPAAPAAKADALRAQGIEAHPFDGTRPVDPAALRDTTHVLCTIAPGSGGDPALGASAAALRPARWLGYLSTTGVYGDRGGDWVDEDTPPQPAQPEAVPGQPGVEQSLDEAMGGQPQGNTRQRRDPVEAILEELLGGGN